MEFSDDVCCPTDSDPVVVQIQPREEGIVQLAAYAVRADQIEMGGVVQQPQVRVEPLSPDGKGGGGCLQPLLRSVALDLKLPEPGLDSLLGQLAVSSEIEQALLTDIEFLEDRPVTPMRLVHKLLLVGEGMLDEATGLLNKVFAEPHTGVIPLDCLLNESHRQVWQGTGTILAPTTDVVPVSVAGSALGLGVDESTRSLVTSALVAEQHALEVMEVDPITLPSAAAGLKHLLNPVIQVLADDRRMPPREDLAFEDDNAGVVRIAEHPVQLACCQRLGWCSPTRSSREALISHGGVQPVD